MCAREHGPTAGLRRLLSGFAVEFGWAVGESVMIPRLLGAPFRLSPAIAGLAFLVNPIFSVFLGPYLGAASDKCTRCNRRTPFIVAYACLAFVGLGVLVVLGGDASTSSRNAWSLGSHLGDIVTIYCAFGVADLCHDLMLTPGRALLIDMSGPGRPDRQSRSAPGGFGSANAPGNDGKTGSDGSVSDSLGGESASADEENADALYSLMQGFGRLVALSIISFPIESVLSSIWRCNHFQASLAISCVALFVCTTFVILAARDSPYDPMLSPSTLVADVAEPRMSMERLFCKKHHLMMPLCAFVKTAK